MRPAASCRGANGGPTCPARRWMSMRTTLIAAAALLALPACQPAGDAAKSGEVMAESGAPGAGPTGKVGDPVAREAQNVVLPSNEVLQKGLPPTLLPAMIPDQFHGRWGLNAADCRGDAAAKGLLTVDDRRLTFYESRGTLDQIDSNSPPDVLVASYGFSGEGMTWQRVVRLERRGQRLRRIEQGGDEGPVDLTYTVCPF